MCDHVANTYVICHQALHQVLVLQHFAALWLDVKTENPGCLGGDVRTVL